MTAPLTDDEAQRVTVCDCGHPWAVHFGPSGGCFAWMPPTAGSPAEGSGLCPCDRDDETLTQVAALLEAREAAALGRAAFEMGAVGAHRPPCRFPDAPCLCRVTEFRTEAIRLVRSLIAERAQ